VTATPAYRECFLYVDAAGVEQVTSELADHLGPPAPFHAFTAGGINVDVTKNTRRLPGRPDDFVDWSTIVEVYANETPDAEMVTFVADLMIFIRSRGHRIVAACDFEDELPQTDFP
jgi:hypothetical protein